MLTLSLSLFFFFFNDTATTEIYTLSLHDALPIYEVRPEDARDGAARADVRDARPGGRGEVERSEEHTSELQSRRDLVCRLLLEKKKKKITNTTRPMITNKYSVCILSRSVLDVNTR